MLENFYSKIYLEREEVAEALKSYECIITNCRNFKDIKLIKLRFISYVTSKTKYAIIVPLLWYDGAVVDIFKLLG